MAENGMSPADIAAVTRPNLEYGPGFGGWGGGYGFGNGFGGDLIWIVLLFALFGMGGGGFGWGGGFGGFGGLGMGALDGGLVGYALGNNATKNDLSDGLNSVQTMGKLDNISTQLNNGFDNVQMQMCNGFNATQREVLQGDNATQREMLQGFNSQNVLALQNTAQIERTLDNNRFTLQSAIDNNRFANQECCCEVKTAIANSDALNFKNTCDVLNAIHSDGEATRAVLVANKIADLEEKLAERARELQTAQIEASQIAQTSQLINALRPTPIPSYLTCSPYMSNLFASNGLGCNGLGLF